MTAQQAFDELTAWRAKHADVVKKLPKMSMSGLSDVLSDLEGMAMKEGDDDATPSIESIIARDERSGAWNSL